MIQMSIALFLNAVGAGVVLGVLADV